MKLMKVISLLAAALLQLIPLDAQTAGVADAVSDAVEVIEELSGHETETEVDVAGMLFGHIGDSYGWHITDWKGKHVTIPLPCIVKSSTGWHVFMSSKVEHGHKYEGLFIAEEGRYEDKIVEMGLCFNFGRGLLQHLGDYYKASDFATAECFVEAAEAKNLNAPQRELVKRLRMAHEHSKVYFEAVAHKSKANTEALVAFRIKHGYPLYTWQEQYYGDITGVEGLLGPEKKESKK
jgi:hypothetical protein